MYLIVVSFILILLIYYVEKGKLKVKTSISLKDSVKNNFNLINIICLSLAFVSLVMVIIIELINGGFVSYNIVKFKFSFLPHILFNILVIPFVEEYFYRFLPNSFKKNNILVSILIVLLSSLVFAYVHKVDSFNSCFLFIMSIVLSIIYLKFKNIFYSYGCHVMYNFLIIIRTYKDFGSASFFFIIFLISIIVLCINKRRVKKY